MDLYQEPHKSRDCLSTTDVNFNIRNQKKKTKITFAPEVHLKTPSTQIENTTLKDSHSS